MMDSTLREQRFRCINLFLLSAFALCAGASALLALRRGDSYAASQAGLGLVMFTFPMLITRLLRFPIPQDCRTLYYCFVFCTVVVGSSLYGYSRIPYWDKWFHFFSGLLISAAGLIICHLFFYSLKGTMTGRRTLYVLFPFLFNLAVAALWEVYEYMLYVLFGIDAVNHLTTGVNDTMQDIIVCLLGGILFSLSVLRWCLRGKRGFLLNICSQFFALRGRELEL